MGNTKRSRRIPAVLMACVAAIISIASFTACSSEAELSEGAQNALGRLSLAGFTDLVVTDDEGELKGFTGMAGTCIFSFKLSDNGLWLTSGAGMKLNSLDPSVSTLKSDAAFGSCFEDQSSVQTTPEN